MSFSLKIGPVDDSNIENEENVEYQVISYCKHNHDKTFSSEKAAAYRSGDLAICIYEHDELIKRVELIKKEGKKKKKGKSYRCKEVGHIRVQISRVISYCRFQSFTFHTFVCSIKYYLLYPIQL